jgi:hypothetical protein
VPPFAHPGEARLHRAEGAREVHRDVAIPLLRRHAVGRGDGVGDRGVRDADVHLGQCLRKPVAREVHREVAAGEDVERGHLEAVGAQPLG